MENKFKVGDRVYHIQYGWGNITDIYSQRIIVKVGEYQYGFPTENNKQLSFTEYTLDGFSQERPEPLPNKGDIVWVRDYEDEEWSIRYFVLKTDVSYYVTSKNPYKEMVNGSYYLYLTTENPYQDGK